MIEVLLISQYGLYANDQYTQSGNVFAIFYFSINIYQQVQVRLFVLLIFLKKICWFLKNIFNYRFVAFKRFNACYKNIQIIKNISNSRATFNVYI